MFSLDSRWLTRICWSNIGLSLKRDQLRSNLKCLRIAKKINKRDVGEIRPEKIKKVSVRGSNCYIKVLERYIAKWKKSVLWNLKIYIWKTIFYYFSIASFCKFVLTNIKLGLCLCLNMIFFFFHFIYLHDGFMVYLLIYKSSCKNTFLELIY